MNNLRKRIISLFLSGAMTLSMVSPFTAFALEAQTDLDGPVITQEQGSSLDQTGEATPAPEGSEGTTSPDQSQEAETPDPQPEDSVEEAPEEEAAPFQEPQATEAPAAETLTPAQDGQQVQVLAENAVAQIGQVYYATLSDALAAAASGQTIILLQDVQLGEALAINKTLTLVAAEGQTITLSRADGYKGSLLVQNDGVLTLGAEESSGSGSLVLEGGAN